MNAPVAAQRLETVKDGRKVYRPDGAMLKQFIRARNHVSVIRGPIGSGKTLAAMNKIWAIACEQAPSPSDGLRKTRWAVVRNTYAELTGSTVKDWLEWFPDGDGGYGTMRWSRPLEYQMALGDVRAEIVFIALDNAEDVKKLRSTQFTGFWFNELQYTSREIFMEAESRTGRYPPPWDGGATWDGVLADMNEPSEDHWLAQMTGEVPYPEDMSATERAELNWPKEWSYLVQPPALIEVFEADGKTIRGYKVNPRAENIRWLKPGYYAEKVRGKTKAWIDSRLMNRITIWVEGSPVWPEFKLETHVAKAELRIQPHWPLYVGLDFGRSPAAVFGQLVNDRWQIVDEIVAFDVSSTTFAPMVKRKLEQRFAGMTVYIYGDPKGQDKPQSEERTSYDIFASFGMTVLAAPCPNNNIQLRLDAVSFALNGMREGLPRLTLDPTHCRTLKVAMAGKYHRERIKGANGETKEQPKKDRYSNCFPADTPISTPSGAVPIEGLSIGDWVSTPRGPRQVMAIMSREVRELVRLSLTDGRQILCTPEHPFAVKGGFIRSDELRYMEKLYSEGDAWDGQQNILSRNSMAANITGCRPRDIIGAIQNSVGRSLIVMFGNFITERFRRVSTSIIATMTSQITGLKIWNSSLQTTTRDITTRNAVMMDGFPELQNVWPRFARSRQFGTAARKEGHGIANKLGRPRRNSPTSNIAVPTAESAIGLSAVNVSEASVRCLVRAWPAKPAALMTSIKNALFAVQRFAQTSTTEEKPATAVAAVDLLRLVDPIRVYDLTVDEAHCFYAQGILVHNCADALQYMLVGAGEGRTMVGLSANAKREPINVRTGRRSLRRAR